MTGTTKQKLLLSILLWGTVLLYFVLNGIMLSLSLPFSTVLILLPLINIVILLIWVLLKTYYNKLKDDVEGVRRLENVADVKISKYGAANAPTTYVPDVDLDTETFTLIRESSSARPVAIFDKSLGEYLVPGRIVNFHHSDDYGLLLRLEVVSATKTRDQIVTKVKVLN